jgi:hypothetical protein
VVESVLSTEEDSPDAVDLTSSAAGGSDDELHQSLWRREKRIEKQRTGDEATEDSDDEGTGGRSS